MNRILICLIAVLATSGTVRSEGSTEPLRVNMALRRAVKFYQGKVSIGGGFLWRYSDDLKLREGEGRASRTIAWVQPPGTPTMGMALLEAYQRTGHKYLLQAAKRTAYALVSGQLQSGGWYYNIEFDKKRRARHAYRSDGRTQGRNITTLDDNTTQSALRFIMRIDEVLKHQDKAIHECARYALKSLTQAQYPNGAWPQRYSSFPNPAEFPIKRASYPKSWSRTFPKKTYRGFYTFNDNAIADMIDTFFEASDIYGDKGYAQTSERAGGFILLAQMPNPQPAWAQQYDRNMHPAWARKFEPPAVTGGESHGVMQTLILLYRRTGKMKYLEPIPRALAYLSKSKLKDGRLARFYELKTNKPLYFTKKYELTYSSADMPTHYGFIVANRLSRIERMLARVKSVGPDLLKARKRTTKFQASTKLLKSLRKQAVAVAKTLDARGAWVEPGRLRYQGDRKVGKRIISTRTFVRNIEILSRYIAADQSRSKR